ncbi:MAG: hypothetical protein V1494_04305 [Candidatus Diapherotrites archaeon]
MNKKIALSLLFIVLLAFLLRVNPLLTNSFPDPDNFFHARQSETIVNSQSVPIYDKLSMQGRYYSYAPLFHVIFAFLNLFSGLPIILLVQLFPAFYGAITALAIFIIARKFFGDKIALFSAFFIATMSFAVLRTAGNARPDGLALLVLPVVIYLLYTEKLFPALLLAMAQAVLHVPSSFYLFSFIIAWFLFFKIRRLNVKEKNFVALAAVIAIIVGLWLLSQHYPLTDYLSTTSFQSSEMSAFSLLGILYFFTIAWPFIIIALFKLKENLFLKTWLVFSLAFGLVGTRLALFFALPAAIFAGFGLDFVAEKVKGREKFLVALLLLLSVAALFPAIYSPGNFVSTAQKSSLLWLNENTPADASIALVWDQGHPLTYFAQRKVVVDGYFEFAPGLEERNKSVFTMMQSSDCNTIIGEAQKWGASFFYAPEKFMQSDSLKYGILEAKNCTQIGAVYEGYGAKIFALEIR